MATRRVRALAVGMALALGGAAGCSDDAEVVSDDGPSPEKALVAAVERTFAGSGRFTLEFDDEDAPDWLVKGEFVGDDVRMTIESDDGTVYETMVVGGVTYTAADSAFYADVPDGIEWLSEDLGASDESFDVSLSGASDGIDFRQLPDLLGTVTEVRDDGTEVVDGVEHRRLKATVPGTALMDAEVQDEGLDEGASDQAAEDADQARFDRIDRYVTEHLTVDVTVLLDPDGGLRRATLAANTDIEEEYRSCMYLFGMTSDSTTTVEIETLDDAEELTAPDPATVSTWEAVMGFDGETFGDEPEGPMLQTSDGELPRSELEFMLGLTSVFSELDAGTIEGMSDEELVARYEEFKTGAFAELMEEDGPWADLTGELDGYQDEMFEGCPA